MIFLFFTIQARAGEMLEKLTLVFSNLPLSEAIKKVEAASNYTFFYDAGKTDLRQRVSLDAAGQDIDKAMATMLQPTNLTFDITNRQIALIPRREQPAGPQQNNPQRRVTGTVVDENGEPVIGANVMEKGTVNGTVTNPEGSFSLNVQENAILQISFIGYITQEISALSGGAFR
ncbi:MAG: carboxypeptidase-like regulatory domain-containing protein [Tannerella sp.]|nr:carboxypeptidase-like regulatory domain-containing protein [Tannerella sp.]